MRIVVCMKQIIDPATVRLSSRGELVTQDAVRTANPADLCALEEALRLKDEQGAEVIVLSLGGPQAEDVLREALAMGADRAVLLSDSAFADSDAHAVSYALARAIETIGGVDLVLAGSRSADDGGGQVGSQIAEHLGQPQVTSAWKLDVAEGRASAVRDFEEGPRRLSVPLPAVLTIREQANVPRLAPADRIMNVYKDGMLDVWGARDIGADMSRVGAAGSATTVRRMFGPEPEARGEILGGTTTEAVRAVVARLRKRGLLD